MGVFTSPDSAAILWDNFLKTATIVSSPSTLSAYTPATNLLVQNRSSLILLTNNSGGSFIFDLGSARRPTAIAILDSNGVVSSPSSAQQWTLYGADDAAITTNVVTWVFPIYDQNITRYYLGADKLAGCAVFSVSNEMGVGIAITSDNKIIVNSQITGNNREVRFLPDGDLDTSFGSGTGYLDTAMSGSSETINYMFEDSNGKRMVIGYTTVGSDIKFLIGRYTDAGILDTTFHSDGQNTVTVSSDQYSYGKGIDEQSTGHYITFGQHGSSTTSIYGFFHRCTSTGGTEVQLSDISPTGSTFTALQCVVDSSDRPVGLGYTAVSLVDIKLCVWRATSTLSGLDTTFNGTGKYEYQFSLSDTTALTIPSGMDIQSSNRIVVASTAYADNDTLGTIYGIWGVIRIRSSSGTLDGSFATNGKFTYDWGGQASTGAVRVLSDDTIIIGGQGYKNGMSCIAFIKLTSEGILDTSFGTGGVSTIFAGALFGQVKDIQVLSSGKLVVTGYFQNYSGTDNMMFLMRLNSDGSIDETFSPSATNDGKRYWKLMMGTTSDTVAKGKIGYLFLGDYTNIRPNLGSSIEYNDESPMLETRSGANYSDIKPIQRDVQFETIAITKDELEEIRNMMNNVGNHSPIILDLFANSSDNTEIAAGTLYGYFDNSGYFNIDLNAAQTDNVKFKIMESPE